MAGPVISWNTVPVFGTWKNIDGTSCSGFVKFTLNQRVGNTPQDTIFPKSGQLIKQLDSNGSIAFDCPVLDDPDNSPIDSSVQIFVEEVFRGSVGASYWIRPTLAMAPDGLDLRSIVVEDHIADPPPTLMRGVPGGLAALNGDGDVIDADGNVISDPDLSGLAPLASPALTGNPTAPTQTAGNSSTRLATTAFVATATDAIVVSAKAHGAVADGIGMYDGAMSASGSTLTSSHGRFTPAHVGKTIGVQGASAPVTTTLTTALNTTGLFNKLAVSALPSAVPAGTLTLTSGGNSVTVKVAAAASGATQLTILTSSFAFAYPIGTTVSIPTALVTTVSGYTSATQVTLAATATTAVTGTYYCVGTDNTAAIQAAINAAKTTVFIDGGSYVVTGLSIPSEITLVGPNPAGWDSSNYYSGRSAELILACGANASLVQSGGFQGRFVTLKNLKLTGSSALQTIAAPVVNIPNQGSGDDWHWDIDNCYISDGSGDGILLGQLTRGTQVKNTYCVSNFGNGITVNGTDTVIAGNYIGFNVGYGIAGFGTAGIVHGGNNIWANAAGVFLGATFGWQVNDNYIDSNRAGGVYVSAGRSHTMVGNKFTSQSAAGFGGAATITLDNSTSEILITGNLMWQQNAGPHSSYGILVNAGSTWTDGGNLITSITYSVAAIGGAGATSYDSGASPTTAAFGLLRAANNLSDLVSASTARGNLGLGTAAVAAKVNAGGTGVLDATDPMAISDGQASPLVASSYFGAIATGTTTLVLSAGTMRGGLLVVGRACTLVEIGLEVTSAGTSGAVLRLGIFKVTAGSSFATARLIDAGTIDGTVLGYAGLTISQAVSIGDKLILVAACQGAPATGPTVRALTGNVPYFGNSTALTASQNAFCGTAATAVTGALPSTHTISGTPTIPRVLIKAS